MAGTDSDIFAEITTNREPAPAEPAEADKVTAEQQEPEPQLTESQKRDERGRFAADKQDDVQADRREASIPPGRLREEADARRRAEQERDDIRRKAEEAERRFAELERRIAMMQQPQRPQAEPPQPPDLIEDPEGYREFVLREAKLQRLRDRVDETFEDAREQNPQAFDEAFRAIAASPQSVKDAIAYSPNPGKALLRWHSHQRALSEIGSDFDGYRKSLRDQALDEALKDPEFRKKAMEAWRDEALASGQTQVRSPNITDLPSVNRATGAASERAPVDPTDASQVFRSIANRR